MPELATPMGLIIRKARRRRQRKYEFDGAADLLYFHFGLHSFMRGSCFSVGPVSMSPMRSATSCSSKFLDANPNALRVGVAAVAHYRF